MYTNKLFIAIAILLNAILFTSCTTYTVIPQAINTVNSVRLDELNLKHNSDYTIVNTTTSEATVIYSENVDKKIKIKEENNEFEITYERDKKSGYYYISECKGVARFGFLTNDYGSTSLSDISPEDIVRKLAIYRLINAAKVRGADGVIEPVISTNVEQRGKDIVFKTTVSAKLIKLSVDAK